MTSSLSVGDTAGLLSVAISAVALAASLAAYVRAGRQYLEDQRDRLLSRITDLNVDVYQRESELVALEHVCKRRRATGGAAQICDEVNAATNLFRDTLVDQKGGYKDLHTRIALACGWRLMHRLRGWRIELDNQAPLHFAQMKDIADHVRKGRERLNECMSPLSRNSGVP